MQLCIEYKIFHHWIWHYRKGNKNILQISTHIKLKSGATTHVKVCFAKSIAKCSHRVSFSLWVFFSCPDRVWNSSIPTPVTDYIQGVLLFDIQSDPGALWPLRHLIRVMRRPDLTKKKHNDKEKYKDKDNDKDKYI